MRYIILGGAAAVSLFCTVPALAGQDPGPVFQVQANPTGPGTPTMTPPNPATADSPVAPSMPADPNYHAGPYKGALTPPPPEAMDKVYPLCTSRLQDSCVNPGEAGNRSFGQRRVKRSRRS